MTDRQPAATSWRLVVIRRATDAAGAAAVMVQFVVDGSSYVMTPDDAEDVAWRLLEAAKLAKAGIGRDDPGMAN